MRRYSEAEKAVFKKIYDHVERVMLGYDSKQHIQKMAVLRIKGLMNGKAVANKATPDNGEYPVEVVYAALLVSTEAWLRIKPYKKFDTEAGAVAYICAIASNRLNECYEKWKSAPIQQKYASAIQTIEHKGAAYRPKEQKIIKGSDDLW